MLVISWVDTVEGPQGHEEVCRDTRKHFLTSLFNKRNIFPDLDYTPQALTRNLEFTSSEHELPGTTYV